METIRKTTLQVFNQMPETFSAVTLCRLVQEKMKAFDRFPMDGTILRRLRELRADGQAPYTVFDSACSIYKKEEKKAI